MDRRIETEVKAALAGIVPLGALRARHVALERDHVGAHEAQRIHGAQPRTSITW